MLVHRLHALRDPLNSALTLQVCSVCDLCRTLNCREAMYARVITLPTALPGSKRASCSHQMQELSFRGGYYGILFWAEIFQDHSGIDLWLPLAQGCLEELRGLTSAADQYLEAHGKNRYVLPCLPATHTSGTQKLSPHAHIRELSCRISLYAVRLGLYCRKETTTQWNTASFPTLMSSSRRDRVFPERALLEEELDAHHMRCIWAAQILTDVAVVSYVHDTCALLQMPPEGIPGLADIVQQLICAFAVVDQYLEVRFWAGHGNLLRCVLHRVHLHCACVSIVM